MNPQDRERLLYATRFVFRRLTYVLGIGCVLGFGYVLRGVLVPLFLAFLLAYALDPFVLRLERAKVPRALAAPLVMAALGAVVSVVLVFAVPYFLSEFRDAADKLPEQLRELTARIEPWLWTHLHVTVPHDLGEVARAYGGELQEQAPELAKSAMSAAFGTFGFVVVVASSLIIPVFALYLLMDFDAMIARAAIYIPRRYDGLVRSLFLDVHTTLGRYIRGQIVACVVLATIYAVGLRIVDVRLAIPIGIVTGMLAFIPYIGFGIGLTMAVAMALLDWHGASGVVGVVVVMTIGQIADGFLVTPRIVGGSVGLRPIEVLLTMTAAGTLFGFLGVLLAVPLGAVVKILVSRVGDAYLGSRYYREVPPAPTETPYPTAELIRSVTPPPVTARSVAQEIEKEL